MGRGGRGEGVLIAGKLQSCREAQHVTIRNHHECHFFEQEKVAAMAVSKGGGRRM